MTSQRQEGYWDEHYEKELKNFDSSGDHGEIWLGKGLNRRIVERLLDLIHSEYADLAFKMIDIGCGNGFLLRSLVDKLRMNYPEQLESNGPDILGIDYSKNSIDLSCKVIQQRNLSNYIKLKQCDFLDIQNVREATQSTDKYDFIVDKGTLDAICLLSDADNLPDTKTKYMNSLYSIVKSGTVFILASCNHTEEELLSLFSLAPDPTRELTHKLVGKIEMPKMKSEGKEKEGSQVTCLVIKFELPVSQTDSN